jgi:hypothetical protein
MLCLVINCGILFLFKICSVVCLFILRNFVLSEYGRVQGPTVKVS